LLARLRSLWTRDEEQIGKWIAKLNADRFTEREAATRKLHELGDLAEPTIRRILARDPPLESRRRLTGLLEELDEPDVLIGRQRPLRAIEVLEFLATEEARGVLAAIANEAPSTRVARDAKDSLARLARRR
jgi:hypothetical protein